MAIYIALAAGVFFIGFGIFIILLCIAAGREAPTPTLSESAEAPAEVNQAPERHVRLRRVRLPAGAQRRYARVFTRY